MANIRGTSPLLSSLKDHHPDRFFQNTRMTNGAFEYILKKIEWRLGKTRYLGLGCPVFFIVSYSKGSLSVSKSSMCHRNHTLDAEANKYLACKRRLTEAEIQSVQDIIGLQSSNASLKAYIRSKFNKQVFSSDLQNLKKKLKRNDNSEALNKVIKAVEEDGGHVRLDVTDSSLNVLSFCTESQRNCCVQYPEMLFMERTYRLNKSDFHLIHILVQDNYGHSLPVFYSFVHSKSANNINILFKQFLHVMGSDLVEKNKSIIVDCDQNILRVTKDHFTNSSVFLCKSHVMQTFRSRVERLLIPDAEKEIVMSIFQKMVNANDIETYTSCCISLSEASSESYKYFQENWEPVEKSWAMLYRRDSVTFGIDSNSRNDLEKGRLKQILKSSQSLAKVVLSLCSKYNNQDDERLYKMFRQRFTSSNLGACEIHPKVAALYQHFTDYAVKRMINNHKSFSSCKVSHVLPNKSYILTVNENEYVVDRFGSCNCQFSKQFRMPCLHVIFLFIHDIHKSQVLLAGSRWLKTNSPSVHSSSANNSVSAHSKNSPAMTQSQKLQAVSDLGQRLNLTLSQCSSNKFNERLAQLKSILDCWEKDEEVFIIVSNVSEIDPGHDQGLNENEMKLETMKKEIPLRELGEGWYENGATVHKFPIGEVGEGLCENGGDIKEIPIVKMDRGSCGIEETTQEISDGRVDEGLYAETTDKIPDGEMGQRVNENMKVEGLLEVSGGDECIRQGENCGEESDDIMKVVPLSCGTTGGCSKASRKRMQVKKRKTVQPKPTSTSKRTKNMKTCGI